MLHVRALLCWVLVAGRSQSLNITFVGPCRAKGAHLRQRCYLLLRLLQWLRLVESCTDALIHSQTTATTKTFIYPTCGALDASVH